MNKCILATVIALASSQSVGAETPKSDLQWRIATAAREQAKKEVNGGNWPGGSVPSVKLITIVDQFENNQKVYALVKVDFENVTTHYTFSKEYVVVLDI